MICIQYCFLVTCPAEGQTFKDCGGSCERTCSDILLKRPFVCDKHYCVPGCACPAGQVINKIHQDTYMYIVNWILNLINSLYCCM